MANVGDRVHVHFVGTLEDGSEFSNSYKVNDPFVFVIGDGEMLPAFERAVIGLEPGGETTVVIPAAEAYGEYDENLVEAVPAGRFPEAYKLPFGEYIEMRLPEGELRVKVLKAEKGIIYFDHNHELAGHDLTFRIKLEKILGRG